MPYIRRDEFFTRIQDRVKVILNIGDMLIESFRTDRGDHRPLIMTAVRWLFSLNSYRQMSQIYLLPAAIWSKYASITPLTSSVSGNRTDH